MSTATPLFYDNTVTDEHLRAMNCATNREPALAGADEFVFTTACRPGVPVAPNPVIAIYRPASEGSQSRDGGVILQATSAITCETREGETLRLAQPGDVVTYPNGTCARIITGSGTTQFNLALVGSRLSNGDEIINTRNDRFVFVERADTPLPDDFLAELEG